MVSEATPHLLMLLWLPLCVGYNADPANIPRGDPEWVGGGERIRSCWIDGTDSPDESRCSQDIRG